MKTKKKRILFLSPFFYPEKISTGKYNSFLVEKLLENNFQIDVVAFYPFYPEWNICKINPSFKNANIFRFGENAKFPKSQILRRIVLELSYLYFVSKYLYWCKTEYSFVISVFPPVLFMMSSYFFLKKAVKIGIIHDVQSVMANTERSLLRSFSASIMGFLEKVIFNKCDKLICLSHSMKNEVAGKFSIDRTKCEVFYPFVSISDSAIGSESTNLDYIFSDGKQHVVYSGALGEKQQPYDLYILMQGLAANFSNVKCHIFSEGPIFNDLVNRSKKAVDNLVQFHGLVDEGDVSSLYAFSTVQIIPQSSGTGSGAFPSKLPNLLAHGVPVFAICDKGCELEIVINKSTSCTSVNSWDMEILGQALTEFLKEIEGVSHKEIFEQNKKHILKEFDVKNLINCILS